MAAAGFKPTLTLCAALVATGALQPPSVDASEFRGLGAAAPQPDTMVITTYEPKGALEVVQELTLAPNGRHWRPSDIYAQPRTGGPERVTVDELQLAESVRRLTEPTLPRAANRQIAYIGATGSVWARILGTQIEVGLGGEHGQRPEMKVVFSSLGRAGNGRITYHGRDGRFLSMHQVHGIYRRLPPELRTVVQRSLNPH